MLTILMQALTPLNYLRIELERKYIFDLVLPGILTVPMMLLVLNRNVGMQVFGEVGLLDKVGDLLGVLVGFFITALAAVATFENKALNQKLSTSAILKDEGRKLELTRRSFLCYLFGYLSLASLFVFLVGAFAGASETGIKTLALEFPWVRPLLAGLYLFVVAHIVSITTLGLYYLVDRIHRPDPEYGAVHTQSE